MKKQFALLGLLLGISVMAENNMTDPPPNSGVCFRMDDNHTPEKWRQLAAVFNRHQQKLCATLNIGNMSKPYYDLIKSLQTEGHEVMDHTPLHNMTMFRFALGKSAADYRGKLGIDHISGNTVFLSYLSPQPTPEMAEIKVRISRDKMNLIEKPNSTENELIHNATVLYVPAGQKVFKIIRTSNPAEFKLRTIWDEPNVTEPDGEASAYFLNDRSFAMTPETIELLGRNTLDNFAAIGVERPYSWIQPGGGVTCISAEQAEQILGKRLGYKSAATYIGSARKVVNEYNPKQSCAYGMMWGDFDEEGRDLAWNKAVIADSVALHHVAFGHSHMRPKDDWNNYLQRLDQLLSWCVEQRIPVHTQSEWADILYAAGKNDQITTGNTFPALTVDRDGNGRPDGYLLRNGTWTPATGMIVSHQRGEIFAVKNLAGLHHGGNRLFFTVYANKENSIRVTVDFPGTKAPKQEKTFTLKSGTNECGWDFTIASEVSEACFAWQAHDDGKLQITSIFLKKP